MFRVTTCILIFLMLTACSSLQNGAGLNARNNENRSTVKAETTYLDFQSRYKDKLGHAQKAMQPKVQQQQDVNYYVRKMMQDLVANLQYVNGKTPMAVTSFVFLDGSYEYADIVGNQLAESFVHEVHKYGIPIVDYKMTEYIRVTESGNFILSRDFLDLESDLPIQYALTGTLVKQPSGYLVNARIVGVKSKAVVATAQGKLPSHVIDSLLLSDKESGVILFNDKSS